MLEPGAFNQANYASPNNFLISINHQQDHAHAFGIQNSKNRVLTEIPADLLGIHRAVVVVSTAIQIRRAGVVVILDGQVSHLFARMRVVRGGYSSESKAKN